MKQPYQFQECLSEVIKDNRKKAKLTQVALAENAGVTRRFIQELENGRSDISLYTLWRLAQGMGISLDLLCMELEAKLKA